MPIHDWTRVMAGTFHDFHGSWITHLKESFNEGLLPEGYYAMSEQHVGEVVADVLTLERSEPRDEPTERPQGGLALAEAPPQVSLHLEFDEAAAYAMRRRTLTVRHRSGHRVVAMVEIVSTGNKDHRQRFEQFVHKRFEQFVHKSVSAISGGVHLLLIDLFPPGSFDPWGMHAAVWESLGGTPNEPPPGKPFVLSSYLADTMPQAFVEPCTLGDLLIPMPLFLDPGRYINVPLEETYLAAWRGMPQFWRDVVEGQREPE